MVPARGGSKGIPRKNLSLLRGKSLVAHAAEFIQSLPWLDSAVISTDDEEIRQEALQHGLNAPFVRPHHLATDTATSEDVWRHAWLEVEDLLKRQFDVSILLEPTSPFRRPADIEATLQLLTSHGSRCAATVSRIPHAFSPQKALVWQEDGTVTFFHAQGASYSRRQDVPPLFHRNGLCYAITREALMSGENILAQHCVATLIDRHVVNIDEPFDLELAEWLWEREQRP